MRVDGNDDVDGDGDALGDGHVGGDGGGVVDGGDGDRDDDGICLMVIMVLVVMMMLVLGLLFMSSMVFDYDEGVVVGGAGVDVCVMWYVTYDRCYAVHDTPCVTFMPRVVIKRYSASCGNNEG